MSDKYDLSKFLIDPKTFNADKKECLVADEFMTEFVAVNLPGDFNASRACDRYEEIIEEIDPDYTPHLFTVVSNHGKADLLISFQSAVEICDLEDPIQRAIREEIAQCGEDPAAWRFDTMPLREDTFDTIRNFYENGFGPQ